jgi:dinuclear metal center YbgI/SA1388 family protein
MQSKRIAGNREMGPKGLKAAWVGRREKFMKGKDLSSTSFRFTLCYINIALMGRLRIQDVTDFLESFAPLAYQEPYDNCGLLTGESGQEVSGILVTLDCTEAVVDEAVARGCNLIIAHHPILFKGVKKLTGANYVERTVIKAIRKNIGIYAIHTNLDNVHQGVNRKICEKIGLEQVRTLAPKPQTLTKLVTFIPPEQREKVLEALYAAGAGQIGNYENCSFSVEGKGTFKPNENANPAVGERLVQEVVSESRVEVIFPSYLESKVLRELKMAHPYEEVAYYFTSLNNVNQEVGSGMIGELPYSQEPSEFLKRLKVSMDLKVIRHTRLLDQPIKKIAVCGGSGSFLLPQARRAGADLYISADFKYHEFFDAEDQLIVADIGHYESEVFTKELLGEVLTKKFPTFAINFSTTVTNPISYL